MAQSLGLLTIQWRQHTIDVEKGSTLKLGGVMNTVVIAGKKVHRAEGMEASEIKVTFPVTRGMSLMKLFDPKEGPLEVLCDTGQTFSWPDAFVTNRPSSTSGEGGKVEMILAAGEPNEVV